jgi:MFS family permease
MDKHILPIKKAVSVFFVFAFGYFLSTLLRAITATLSPTLTSEFGLQAADLGLLAGGYFLGFGSMQIPLGYLLDKHGPKKIVSSFLLIAFIGVAAFALSKNFSSLFISRILIGVGVSACLMGPLTAYRIWFADEHQQRLNSWMLMVGSFGYICSSLPVQLLLPNYGWRLVFGGLALLIVICIGLILLIAPSWQNYNEENKDKTGSLSEVWKNEFFRSLIPIGIFNYGGMFAILTLWAGPWMTRVSGYTPIESATGLFWINVTMLISFFLWGYALPKLSIRGFGTMKLLKLGLPISFFVLFIIILLGSKAGSIHWTIYILSTISLSLTQPAVALAFPKHLAGKAFTSYNLILFIGIFAMQWGIGLIIDLVKHLGFSEIFAFQVSFFVFLVFCVLSYFYFIYCNRKS